MLIKNAIKKLEAGGYTIEAHGGHTPAGDRTSFRAVNGRQVITFHRNGDSDRCCAFGATVTDAGQYDTPMFGWPSLKSIIDAQRGSIEQAAARAVSA